MTLLNQLPKEKQTGLTELLDREIELLKKRKEIAKTIQRKTGNRIKFFEDVKKSRQTLQNLLKVINYKSEFKMSKV